MSLLRPDELADPRTLSPEQRKEIRSVLRAMFATIALAIVVLITVSAPDIVREISLAQKAPNFWF